MNSKIYQVTRFLFSCDFAELRHLWKIIIVFTYIFVVFFSLVVVHCVAVSVLIFFNLSKFQSLCPQHLVSQQKEGDAEEKQKITVEKEAQQKRIAQLIEEAAKLRTELARYNTPHCRASWSCTQTAAGIQRDARFYFCYSDSVL